MSVFLFLRVDYVMLAVSPKHRQVTINYVPRHAQFCAESMPLEAADKAARGAALMFRRGVDNDFHAASFSITAQNR